MEEYAIFRNYKKVIDHREGETINTTHRYIIDAEELEYWKSIYPELDTPLEPESTKPF